MDDGRSSSPVETRRVHKALSAKVVLGRLRGKILRGEYPEGTPLRQEALAVEFGLSRIPVREALRQLEAEGLVTFVPHAGAVVSVLSIFEIQQLFELRALLETELLRRAIPSTSAEDLTRAEAALDAYSAALVRGDPAEWGLFNRRFHAALLSPAKLPVYMKVLENLLDQSDRYMHLSLTHGDGEAEVEHRAILNAVSRKESQYACSLLSAHILEASRRLEAFIRADRERSSTSAGRNATKPSSADR